jgi:hypothetical protein
MTANIATERFRIRESPETAAGTTSATAGVSVGFGGKYPAVSRHDGNNAAATNHGNKAAATGRSVPSLVAILVPAMFYLQTIKIVVYKPEQQ